MSNKTTDTLAVPLSPQDISRIFRRTHGGSLNTSDWEFADQLQRECMLRMGVATLRDDFAAKAMAALIVASKADWPDAEETESVSEKAYLLADAMLKERAK